jgi:hypothetical protein
LAASTAKGFSSRALRTRKRATAAALRASQRSWKPPSPFKATMAPARSKTSVSASASPSGGNGESGAASHNFGPHAGQALGWA